MAKMGWVNKVISKLVEIGLVERTHRTRDDGGDRACLYRLIAPMDIKTPCPAPEAAESPTDNTVSSEGNTPSHNRDSITTELEIIQDSPPAGAREDSIIRSFQAEIPAEDWQPSDADLLWAMERYPDADLTSVTERFVNRCRSKGYRYKDLGSAWRSWLADDHGKVHQPPRGISRGRGIQKQSAAQSRFDAWASVAQQASREVRHAA